MKNVVPKPAKLHNELSLGIHTRFINISLYCIR